MLIDPRHACRHGHALAKLSVRTFAATTRNHREWPGYDLMMGDCEICGSSIAIPLEDWDAAHREPVGVAA